MFKVAGRDILVDVGHAHQRLVQFFYILSIQFDSELVTGQDGLSGGGDVFAVAVDIDDDAVWEQYKSDLESYNLSRVLEIRQAAYDRYLER